MLKKLVSFIAFPDLHTADERENMVMQLLDKHADRFPVYMNKGQFEVIIESLIKANRKIHAIKLYRDVHGTSLRDSKHAVEAIAADLSPKLLGV